MLTALVALLTCVIVGLLLNKLAGRVALSLLALGLSGLSLRADAPEYAGNAFDHMQEVADDGLLFFGVIVAAAIVVTGFFLGRRWLRRIG